MAGTTAGHRGLLLHASIAFLVAGSIALWVAHAAHSHSVTVSQPPAADPTAVQARTTPVDDAAAAVTPAALAAETSPSPPPAPDSSAAPPESVQAVETEPARDTEGAAAPPPSLPKPRVITARAVTTAHLRTSPSTDALIVGSLPAGTVVQISGCASGCSWLMVQTPGGAAWSAAFFFSVSEGLQSLPNR